MREAKGSGLALASRQTLTWSLHTPLLPQQDGGRKWDEQDQESLWVEIKTRLLLTSYHHGQSRQFAGELSYFITI